MGLKLGLAHYMKKTRGGYSRKYLGLRERMNRRLEKIEYYLPHNPTALAGLGLLKLKLSNHSQTHHSR
jgi:hypothetical protein